MKKAYLWIGLAAFAILAAVGVYFLVKPTQKQLARAELAVPASNPAGFARANGPIALSFPKDMGPHPDYQTEWWYYTGNLDTPEGRHFGYQLTFFRRALIPPNQVQPRESDWATAQVYMAHFALTDVASQKFHSFERVERGAAGLAGASVDPNFQVWLQDWSVKAITPNTYQLIAAQDDLALRVTLQDQKGIILEGDRGYSQKGPQAGNASYYTSQTRLQTVGTLSVLGETFRVSGTSWMDHEYSTSALSQDQVGWDWFGLQLSDQTEAMIYRMRRADGSVDPFSSGTFIDREAKTQTLKSGDFSIQATGKWKSPSTGAEYPSGWNVKIPGAGLDLQIEPFMPDQENRLTFVYWEGAVRVHGTHDGKPVSGVGYVELTGYSGSFAGQF